MSNDLLTFAIAPVQESALFDSDQYSAVGEDSDVMLVLLLSNSVAKNELTTEPT